MELDGWLCLLNCFSKRKVWFGFLQVYCLRNFGSKVLSYSEKRQNASVVTHELFRNLMLSLDPTPLHANFPLVPILKPENGNFENRVIQQRPVMVELHMMDLLSQE